MLIVVTTFPLSLLVGGGIFFLLLLCVLQKVEKCEVFAREKEREELPNREKNGREQEQERERKSKKKSNQHENNQSAARCKNGRVGYFVLFLQSKVFICGLKWS